GRLYSIAFRVTGDRHLAEDAVQELFLRLLRGAARYRGSGSAAAWLASATARAAIDVVRRRAARPRRGEAHTVPETRRGSARAPARDEGPLCAGARATFPPERGACLGLHFAEALPVREVAAAIGKRKSSTAERIRDGAEKVRAFLRRKGVGLAAAPPLERL